MVKIILLLPDGAALVRVGGAGHVADVTLGDAHDGVTGLHLLQHQRPCRRAEDDLMQGRGMVCVCVCGAVGGGGTE